MTDHAAKARDDHLVSAIALAITEGFAVEESEGRGTRIQFNPEETNYVVFYTDKAGQIAVERFNDPVEAVRYYLDACDET